ncbi:MAG: O-antigen ligase family protein [Thermonemataceae bacterium]|nr:O-antigen ligase family protein [Thermonemataceae bacterium]
MDSILMVVRFSSVILFFYLLSLFAFAFTLPIDKLIGVNSVALILLSATWLVDTSWRNKWQNIRREPYIWGWIAYFLIVLVGLIYTEPKNLAWGVEILQRKLPLMALPLILLSTNFLKNIWIDRLLKIFVWALAGVAVFALLRAFYAFQQEKDMNVFYNEKLASWVRMSGIYLAVMIGTALLIVSEHILPTIFRRKEKFVWFLITFLLLILLFMLNIRMAIGALLVVYIFIWINKFRWRGIAVAFGVILVATIIITSNRTFYKKFYEAINMEERIIVGGKQDHSLAKIWGGRAIRFAIWECAWEVVEGNFWYGVGTGDVQTSLQQSYEENNFLFASRYNEFNAHNQFLETQLSVGIIGFLLLLFNFIYLFIRGLRKGSLLIFAFTLYIFLNSLTESFLERQKGITLYAFIAAILLLHQRNKAETAK